MTNKKLFSRTCYYAHTSSRHLFKSSYTVVYKDTVPLLLVIRQMLLWNPLAIFSLGYLMWHGQAVHLFFHCYASWMLDKFVKNDEQLGIVLQFGRRPEISGTLTPGCRAPPPWTTPSCLSPPPLGAEQEIGKVNLQYVFNTHPIDTTTPFYP